MRLSDGTVFPFGSFEGQVNNQSNDPGFLDLSGGIPDPVTGLTSFDVSAASDYLFVNVTSGVVFCLQPQVPAAVAGVIDCDGGSDFTKSFLIDHNIGMVEAGGITSNDCLDANGHVEGSHRLCAAGRVDETCRTHTECDTVLDAGDGVCGLDEASCTQPQAQSGNGCRADGDCDSTELSADGVCGFPGSHFRVCNGPLSEAPLTGNSGAGALRFSEPGLRFALSVEDALPCGDEGEGLATFLPFTSGRAAATILDADNTQSSTFSFETQGQAFSCANWTSLSAPGCVTLVIPALDQFIGGLDTITELHLCGQ